MEDKFGHVGPGYKIELRYPDQDEDGDSKFEYGYQLGLKVNERNVNCSIKDNSGPLAKVGNDQLEDKLDEVAEQLEYEID